MATRTQQKNRDEAIYISPNELSRRWQCSRSSVDRIARRAGMTRICLGEGRNGIIRYLREEALAYEFERTIKLQGMKGGSMK